MAMAFMRRNELRLYKRGGEMRCVCGEMYDGMIFFGDLKI